MANALTTTPSLTPEGSLSRYLAEIRQFPMLEKDEEYMLAKRYAEHDDGEAAQKLITSHLRLVAKIAMGYRGYGLPIGEVISEGNVGLMQAVKKFDPEKGFRLATYAMWWIRASIQEYVLRSWSLVKIGTTAAQKKLFFNLRKIKGQIDAVDDGDLHPDQVEHIATKLGVTHDDVVSMNRRMSGGEASLNAPMSKDADGGGEWQDWLVDDDAVNPEAKLAHDDEYEMRMELLERALATLNEREQNILTERRLKDNPSTLEELSQVYGVSRERVRQIEVRAFEKLQKAMKNMDREARQPREVEDVDA
ncbi:MAG: RNA polymerase sigma factor RpoH [Marinicaulis sp.]|nr:RNA polymerase sigma factor RpoH [Marinicaulis sp.]NNE41917.1 RNA polymerase sigma factor RpoH [Marinicaulis sp.]NNL88915.1 RNA polymerase sigma factor RpoH [Marinicaulis sp.]